MPDTSCVWAHITGCRRHRLCPTAFLFCQNLCHIVTACTVLHI